MTSRNLYGDIDIVDANAKPLRLTKHEYEEIETC